MSSQESAAIGGAAHLVNFMGSDTVAGIWLANLIYHHPMAGFSVPAAEHSTMTAWGREGEVDAYRNMLTQFAKPGSVVAVVSDSWDLWNALENIWGGTLKEAVLSSGATVVIRPDSGHPATVVLRALRILEERFGVTTNSKGFKVLNAVRIIQGDGVDRDSLQEVLELARNHGYSATNLAFGMGGALLQRLDRDTQKFADYLMPLMKTPTNAEKIMNMWAKKPLDYDPGTKWQYSNTGFVIAGAIVEKVSGIPFFTFLQRRVFKPLLMKSVWDSDQQKLTEADSVGHSRYALGPVRPSMKEGPGWMYAAGELAMTAEDLARWDLSVMNHSLLKPDSYRELETEVRLNNGVGTRYGLGIGVTLENQRRVLKHDGEVMGFTAGNAIYPDDHIAVVVLINQDAIGAYEAITKKIVSALFDQQDPSIPMKLELAKRIFTDLQHGNLDRTLFTDNCNSYFDETARQDIAKSISGLGEPTSFVQTRQALRGGMTVREFLVSFPKQNLTLSTYEMPDGKMEQYLIAPEE